MDFMMIFVHEMDNFAQNMTQMRYCGFVEVNAQRSIREERAMGIGKGEGKEEF